MSQYPVIALVTAYNEEKTIGNVLEVLKKCPSIDRIQVVDDGSTDRTPEIVREKNTSLFQIPHRKPIGEAIQHHLKHISESEAVLLWCDADLLNLQVSHIETILRNLRENNVSMSIGVKDNFPFLPWLLRPILPMSLLNWWIRMCTKYDLHVGGERAIYKSVFEKALSQSDLTSGYGIVFVLNRFCRLYAKGSIAEFLPRLTHRNKYQKWGFWRGMKDLLREIWQFMVTYIRIRKGFLKKRTM